ncbi:cytochrome p450 [Fusarium longipes]|uniref:Cytochrome p450 n=1 Tax=Fusarium longipes TaxID=694270 RepID=A0A395SG95_9HYPO|nr:cytochrome p450 [Fusarium longipes]
MEFSTSNSLIGTFGLFIPIFIFLMNYFSKPNVALLKVPGPLYARFTNLPLKIAVITGRRTFFVHQLHQKYGPVVRVSPSEVSVVDAEACKMIHKAGSGFPKSPYYARFIDKPVPTLFAMMSSKDHSERRRVFARAFSKTEIRSTWDPMVRETVQLALDKIAGDLVSGKADIMKWLLFMATDISGHLMFGESFRTLENGEMAGKGGIISEELPLVGFIGYYLPIPAIRDVFRANAKQTILGEEAIENGIQNGTNKRSIFKQLDEGFNILKRLDLSAEAGNFILAGTDTTAFTLTCLLWAVLRYSSLQVAIEEEVAGLPNDFNDAHVEALPLVGATINETLRLYGPAAGSLPRIMKQGGAELGGHFIPEGVTVSTQAFTLHRDEHFWPNPEKFDPYRWLGNSVQEAAKMAFAPFGTGPRACIGLHLAQMEMRYTIALFFRRFKGAKLTTESPMSLEFENYFLLKPKGEFTIIPA